MCCATCLCLLNALVPAAEPWGTLLKKHSSPSGYQTPAQPAWGPIWSDGRFRKPCKPSWLLCLFALRMLSFSSQAWLLWACWCRNQGVVTRAWRWEGWLRAQLVKITIGGLCYPGQSLLAASGHEMTHLVLEEHLLWSSWPATKCLKKGGGLAHIDDSETHPYSPRPRQSVDMCSSMMEEPPILLCLRSSSQRQTPQPKVFSGGTVAKVPLMDGWRWSQRRPGCGSFQGSFQLQERHVTILFPSRSQAAARYLISGWKMKPACLTFLIKLNCLF